MKNMDRTRKGVIAVLLAAIILAVAWYGSYLPMRKAQAFIATLQGFQSQPPTSLQDLESRLSSPLDAPSPIGQEELVRNTANNVLGFVQRGVDATSTAQLIGFLSSYYNPIIARGRGMSFGQDLYLLGVIHETAFAKTGNPAYLQTALQYYKKADELGPDRPQPLYGLFDIYRAMGDVNDTQMVANKIMANWPSDQNIPNALRQFLSQVKAVTGSRSAK